MPWRKPVEQLAGPPIRMAAPRRAQQVGEVRCDAMWTVVRGMAPVAQAAPPTSW
jgi:hypothetical protein